MSSVVATGRRMKMREGLIEWIPAGWDSSRAL